MPGLLTLSPADIISRLLVVKILATDPSSNTEWPAYVNSEPTSPDRVITVYDTEGVGHGRIQVSGFRPEHHGIQIRIRSDRSDIGYTRGRLIAVTLEQNVYEENITIDGVDYKIHSLNRQGDVIPLGSDAKNSKRFIHTVNFLTWIHTC